jgi:RNA polymerase sigma-70 factor, ECF subfamily
VTRPPRSPALRFVSGEEPPTHGCLGQRAGLEISLEVVRSVAEVSTKSLALQSLYRTSLRSPDPMKLMSVNGRAGTFRGAGAPIEVLEGARRRRLLAEAKASLVRGLRLIRMRSDQFKAIAIGLLSALYNAAVRLTRESHDAEDLVQDTYAYAFAHAAELRSSAAAKAWLMRILYHRFISERRRRSLSLRVIEGGSEAAIADHAVPALEPATIGRLARPAINAALDRLPDEMRTALLMCVVEGMSYQEIAEVMDCPVGTVRSRIARARARLMSALAAEAAALGIGKESKR